MSVKTIEVSLKIVAVTKKRPVFYSPFFVLFCFCFLEEEGVQYCIMLI